MKRGHGNTNATSPINASFEVRIRIPAGAPFPSRARIVTPDSPLASTTVPVTLAADGRASFMMPSLRIYAIADLH